MNPIDIIIIIAAVLAVAGFIGYRIWKKRTGKSTGCCDCDCSSCGVCPHAPKQKEQEDA